MSPSLDAAADPVRPENGEDDGEQYEAVEEAEHHRREEHLQFQTKRKGMGDISDSNITGLHKTFVSRVCENCTKCCVPLLNEGKCQMRSPPGGSTGPISSKQVCVDPIS